MTWFTALFHKRDGAKVLGPVFARDALVLECSSMGVDPKFVRPDRPKRPKRLRRPENTRDYKFKRGGQTDRLLYSLSQGVHLTNETARLICGGAGSRGERRLAEAKSWLKLTGYVVRESFTPPRRVGDTRKSGLPAMMLVVSKRSCVSGRQSDEEALCRCHH